MNRRRTFLSLFSGCGGLDLGFLEAGFAATGAFEIDPAAVATYAANLGPRHIHQFDLVNWKSLRANRRPTVVIAGPPCQGFSLIGKMDPSDQRNELFLVPLKLGVALNAQLIVVENVPGIFAPQFESLWNRVHRFLARHGYSYRKHIVQCTDLGLPQQRTRVVLTVGRGNLPEFGFPVRSTQTLRSVLDVPAGVSNHNPHVFPKESHSMRIAMAINAGQKLCNVRGGPSSVHTWDIPDVFGPTTSTEREFLQHLMRLRRVNRARDTGDADPVPGRLLLRAWGSSWRTMIQRLTSKGYTRHTSGGYDLRHTFNGKYRRLAGDEPSLAVLTKYCDPRHFLHPYEHRGFTPREAARVQGFDDGFTLIGSQMQQTRLVGNAVPPVLSRALARWAAQVT